MDKRVIRGIYLYEFKLGTTAKEADEKINAAFVKDVPQFGRRIVGIRSSGMEMKLNELSIETLPYPPFSPDLSPTDYHFFKHLGDFLVGKIFKYQQDAESAFEDFVNSRTSDFYAAGIKKSLCHVGKDV
ncbi:unnamed protein product [Heligmosomoides polygyrus]|uniref:HTH_48 domain-containing protein n=1 Tax=Heligmosomoides polygyrus TaxID=6339 RepID=A0A183FQ24_HELPZ|nr:unnamed protein product [Heligmosomoides polygyrus]